MVAQGDRLHVEVWIAGEGDVQRHRCELEPGATVAHALAAAGLDASEVAALAQVDGRPMTAVWGRLRPLQAPLADGDRVELHRPLRIDPKLARQARVRARRETSPDKWVPRDRRGPRQRDEG